MCALTLLCAGVSLLGAIGTAPAASTSTSVGATVLSSTNVSTASCAENIAGRTHFGSITAGSFNVTTTDCSIQFGSSNDTARLLMRQTDGRATRSDRRPFLKALDFHSPDMSAALNA